MAKTGDYFIIELKRTHLEWGTYRYTNSRGQVYGEGYLPIPSIEARKLNLFNSNNDLTGLGYNEFYFSTSDGFIKKGILKSGGCSSAGNIYAKNFHGSGNLKLLGDWFYHINAVIGDKIKIEFLSADEIFLAKL